jgi:threonine/homoserine/homoserine lactone efflux protein
MPGGTVTLLAMPDAASMLVFAAAALALLLVPGPAVMFIVTRSLADGRRAGLAAVLGVQVGALAHVLAATVGLSALLVSSALAFSVVKYAGAAYLVYLGLRKILARDPVPDAAAVEHATARAAFRQGVIVNLLNPKTALFFLAFLPQFVNPARGPVSLQVLVLGLTFVGLAVVTDSVYALASGSLAAWARSRRSPLAGARRLAGGVYVALGVTAALSGSQASK